MGFIERHFEIVKFDLIDGSVGKCWSYYRKQQEKEGANWLRDRVPYEHPFPDKRKKQLSWAYHINELMYFRAWFQDIYTENYFWNYLKGKYNSSKVKQLEVRKNQLILA